MTSTLTSASTPTSSSTKKRTHSDRVRNDTHQNNRKQNPAINGEEPNTIHGDHMNDNEDMIIDSDLITSTLKSQQAQSSSSSCSSSTPSTSSSPSSTTKPTSTTSSTHPRMYMRLTVPPHRYTPLRKDWLSLYQPIVEHMKIQIRFNVKKRCIELRTSNDSTEQQNSLTKSYDYLRAYMLGYDIRDAIALLRLDDLFIDTFEIKDVKTLEGEHLSRAIGRIAGVGGKTKFTIENATRTRIIVADTHIHILGTYSNIQVAKNAMVRLIMGSPPSKVYTQMRAVATRQKQRF